MRRLTDALRDLEGHDDVPILIDQEGGRVARMRPPEWPAFPSGEAFDRLYQLAPSSAIEAARVNARALGLMLHEVGVNVDCLPMLDVRQPGATDIVGDRALGVGADAGRGARPRDPRRAGLGRRASASSSISRAMAARWSTATRNCRSSTPARRSSTIDLEPFERLRDAAMGMTSHVALHRLGRRSPRQRSRRS